MDLVGDYRVLRFGLRQTKPAWGSLFGLPILFANQGRSGLYVLPDPFLIRFFSVADYFWRKTALGKTSILRDDQNQIGKVGSRCPNHQKLIMSF